MKATINFFIFFFFALSLNAQTSEIIINVDWPQWSTENKVELYSPAGVLISPDIKNLYDGSGPAANPYDNTENYGFLVNDDNLPNGTGYYVIVYDRWGDGWNGGGNMTITVDGTTTLTFNGAFDVEAGGNVEETKTIYFEVVDPTPPEPGDSIFYEQYNGDSREYIEYIKGNLPIIISAPHGGVKQSGSTIGGVNYPDNDATLPDRNCGTNERDDNTELLVRRIQDEIFALTGCYAHIIINNLHRSKLDPNREVGEAACGDQDAIDHWNAFHDFIDQASTSVETNWGKGLYIDLHGQSHSIPRIELGYNITASQLNTADLNSITGTSITNLVANNLNSYTQEQLVRGPNSLGALLHDSPDTFYASQGYPNCSLTSGYRAIPSDFDGGSQSCDDTQPYNNAYFNGDFYNNERHGSGQAASDGLGGGGNVDGIMSEVNRRVRDLGAPFDSRPNTLEPFAIGYGRVILDYIDLHYNDFAEFNYSAASYNTADPDPTPIISGASNGLFSSTSGLIIDANTGTIDTSTSTAGNYVVTYSIGTCDYFDETQNIEITNCISNTGTTLSPGDVKSNLQLWLKSNDGVTLAGNEVTSWNDQSINSYSAIKENSVTGPTRVDESLNFNPAFLFDGTNFLKILNTACNLNLNPISDKVTFFTVFTSINANSTGTILSKGNTTTTNYSVWLENTNRTVHYTGGKGSGVGNIGNHWGDGTLDTRYESKISRGLITDGTYGGNPRHVFQSFVNGVGDDFPAENPNSDIGNAGIGSASENTDILIGALRNSGNTGSSNNLVNSTISEIIIYDRNLNTSEINKIETYLALKYGITLGYNDSESSIYTGVSGDYIASDGTTIMWDGSSNSGFGYNVFGLVRDDDSELLQLKSKSSNVERMGSGPTILNSVLTVESVSGIIDTDKSYLIFGQNGNDIQLQSSIVPERILSTINRIWKTRESVQDVGAINLYFDLSQYTISNPQDLELIISNNNNLTNYKNYVGSYDVPSGTLTFTDVNINDNAFFTLAKPEELQNSYHLSFDGTTNYIDLGDNFDLNPTGFTISAWVKRGTGSGEASIISKRNNAFNEGFDFKFNGADKFQIRWKSATGANQQVTSTLAVPAGKWHHLAAIYNGTQLKMYIDGLENKSLDRTPPTNTEHSFLIGAAAGESLHRYFNGDVDEVQVWNIALTESQLRYIMNQEIENKSGSVVGSFFESRNSMPTNNDISGLSWNDLKAYYPLSHIKGNCVFNASSVLSTNGRLFNFPNNTSIMAQTAPLPYMSSQIGNWNATSSWINGDVQTIPGSTSIMDDTMTIDWNIVKTTHQITIDNDSDLPSVKEGNRTVLGLFIDNSKLILDGNNILKTGYGLTITHYLDLMGDIDLNGESQLVQSLGSDLAITSTGILQKDQQGTLDLYTYNYWASPVGANSIMANNNTYKLVNVLKDGTNPLIPATITFLPSAYDGSAGPPISIADYWIWKYNNLPSDEISLWQQIGSTGDLLVGEGYTMKGTVNTNNSVTQEQNYVFDGKPNNGPISLNINAGSDYLVGNPYSSAIDADKFIQDNGPEIDYTDPSDDGSYPETNPLLSGTLYFWDHWGGNSHASSDYQGGYATYNFSGAVAAAAIGTNDPNVGTGGTPVKIPGQFIPVGQGFFVVGENNGTINFNNGQRVYKKESINSVFMRSNNTYPSTKEYDSRLKIRLGFNSVNTLHRQLLLTVDERASINYDWGFDAKLIEEQLEDSYWLVNGDKYNIQGINEINSQTILPIGMHSDEDGLNIFTIEVLENVPNDLEIYIHDKLLNVYHDLRDSDYETYLLAGEYFERFEITFSNPALSIDDFVITNGFQLFYSNENDSIIVNNPILLNIESIEMFNVLGQTIFKDIAITTETVTRLSVGDLKVGTYIVKLKMYNGNIISKKVIVI